MSETKWTAGMWDNGMRLSGKGIALSMGPQDDEAVANGKLAKAAPDLYRALEKAADALAVTARWVEEDQGLPGTAGAIRYDESACRIALAKARGETS